MKTSPATPSVGTFKLVLTGALTQYDRRESRRHPNVYRLGHLFAAMDRAMAGLDVSSTSHESLVAFVRGIEREFIVSDMTPARNTIKAIKAWITEGKYPKYPVDRSV